MGFGSYVCIGFSASRGQWPSWWLSVLVMWQAGCGAGVLLRNGYMSLMTRIYGWNMTCHADIY